MGIKGYRGHSWSPFKKNNRQIGSKNQINAKNNSQGQYSGTIVPVVAIIDVVPHHVIKAPVIGGPARQTYPAINCVVYAPLRLVWVYAPPPLAISFVSVKGLFSLFCGIF